MLSLVRPAPDRRLPSHHIFVRIRPQQITKQALVWNVGRSHYSSYLFHRLQVRTKAAVTAEDFLVHDGGHGQTVEAVREGFPELYIVTTLT